MLKLTKIYFNDVSTSYVLNVSITMKANRKQAKNLNLNNISHIQVVKNYIEKGNFHTDAIAISLY